jgi:uncharacterized membrane protein
MDDLAIARALHVIAVVMWIGGVAFVTMVLLPSIRRREGAGSHELFEALESPFARQARVTTLIAGLTGFYMVWRLDAWDRFMDPAYWWMHGMVLIWALFTLMLFVLEPWFLHAWFRRRAAVAPAQTMALIQRLHMVLITLSLIVIFGAVFGAHS